MTEVLSSSRPVSAAGGINNDNNNEGILVDTSLLLNSIKELETSLSEYHRQDRHPKWADTIVMRLDALELAEKEAAIAARNAPPQKEVNNNAPSGERLMGPGVHISDVVNDERIVGKVRSEMDFQITAVKIAIEKKISATLLEMDRLFKLLQIRPTMSEMQMVVVSLNDINKKMNDTFRDISGSVKTIVQDKVAEEMTMVMAQLKNSEKTGLEIFDTMITKLNGFAKDIENCRTTFQEGFDELQNTLERLDDDIMTTSNNIKELREQVESESITAQEGLAEIRFNQQLQSETVAEFRKDTNQHFRDLESHIKENDNEVQGLSKTMEDRYDKVTDLHAATKDNLMEFRGVYEFDISSLKQQLSDSIENVTTAQATLDDISTFVNQLRDVDVINRVNRHESDLAANYKLSKEIDEKVSSINGRAVSLTKQATTLDESMRKFPSQIQEQVEKVDNTLQQVNKQGEFIVNLQDSLINAQNKIDELSNLKESLIQAKTSTSNTDQRLKYVQTMIVQLQETNDSHDDRIEKVISSIHQSQEETDRKIAEMRVQITDTLSEKMSEMDAAVDNMRDNLEMLGHAGDDKSVERSVKSIGVSSRKASMSMKKGGGAPIIDLDPTLYYENQAQFIADLCLNFEEISMRKAIVPDIPPAMCENITSTAQGICAYVANFTDAQMVQEIISSAPEEADYEEDLVVQRRQEKLEEFLDIVYGQIFTSNSEPGAIRGEARERFIRQTRKALQLCMSKHDQVLIAGNSRLGKIKIPCCIACDRPLVERVRQDTFSRGNDDSRFSSKSVVSVPYFNKPSSSETKTELNPVRTKSRPDSNSLKLLVPRALADLDRPMSQERAVSPNSMQMRQSYTNPL